MTPKARILIADDDRLMRAFLSDTLECFGYIVSMAVDGEEALNKIRAGLPDLILLDILMPKLNGIQVAKAVKRDPATSGIPIIIVTVLPGTPATTLSRAEVYLQKPVHPHVLRSHIETLLRAPRTLARRPAEGDMAARGRAASEGQ